MSNPTSSTSVSSTSTFIWPTPQHQDVFECLSSDKAGLPPFFTLHRLQQALYVISCSLFYPRLFHSHISFNLLTKTCRHVANGAFCFLPPFSNCPTRPWINHIEAILQDFVSTGHVKVSYVTFDTNEPRETLGTSIDGLVSQIPLYTLSTSSHSGGLGKKSTENGLGLVEEVASVVLDVMQGHDITQLAKEILPPISVASVESELIALRRLRDEHVAKIQELNALLESKHEEEREGQEEESDGNRDHSRRKSSVTGRVDHTNPFTINNSMDSQHQEYQQSTNRQSKTQSSRSIYSQASHDPSVSEEIARLDEHKRSKLRMRQEMKEILQALGGLLADLYHVSFLDIIAQFKQKSS